MNKKKILILTLGLILTCDFTYSFLQYYSTPLDGDMAGGIVPEAGVQEIFNDPFGFGILSGNEKHPNPNRFFAHLFFRDYFQKVPLLLQKVVDPIESVYLSCAWIKLLIQVLFIYLLSAIISKSKSVFNLKFVLVALLLTPLFQAYGYNGYMGIIDKSITYTFFYALPLVLLLLFISNFHPSYNVNRVIKMSTIKIIALVFLTVVLPFSGPLIPLIILIITLLLFIFYLRKNYSEGGYLHVLKNTLLNIPKDVLLFFIPISLLSIYSLLLGMYNSTYQAEVIPIAERYLRLPVGVYFQFTQKMGFPILFAMIGSNIFIIKKYFNNEGGRSIITSLKWIGVFSLLYVLLLPLGGYRPYRPNILRYDTIMPITICLFYIFGASTSFLLEKIKKGKNVYYAVVITFLVVFENADKSELNENECEKQALITLSNSDKEIVSLQQNCPVISWKPITDYNQSKLNAELLKIWNITEEAKLYYNSSR